VVDVVAPDTVTDGATLGRPLLMAKVAVLGWKNTTKLVTTPQHAEGVQLTMSDEKLAPVVAAEALVGAPHGCELQT
jgi:hypothetical protein